MSKRLNQLVVEEFRRNYEGIEDMVFVNYLGLSSEDARLLRDELRDKSVGFRVVKNSLARQALQEMGFSDLNGIFNDGTAIVVYPEDAVTAAKTIVACAQKYKQIKIKGGISAGAVVDAAAVESLAKIPSREELIGQVIGLAIGQAGQVIALANAPGAKITGAVEALVEKLEGDQAA